MKRSGFTLLEILVSIAIMMLLAGLILSGLNVARSRAHRLRAQNEIHQIKTVWTAYLADYRVPPDDITDTGRDFARLMRGENINGGNRRGYTYMDFHADSQGMVDPWGNPYQFVFAGAGGVAVTPHGSVNESVAIWSMGPSGSSEMPEDRRDDVFSWRDAD